MFTNKELAVIMAALTLYFSEKDHDGKKEELPRIQMIIGKVANLMSEGE